VISPVNERGYERDLKLFFDLGYIQVVEGRSTYILTREEYGRRRKEVLAKSADLSNPK
ncbi:MAG: hypothetical protein JWQ35_617, partial [Bacteriovoracaceae bacterium]|nr:hypothetical protein [Bacteriovoracaceae bacterium]